MPQILNIAGYKFTPLAGLAELREKWLILCNDLGLKGTILLSVEGININLSGTLDHINSFKLNLTQDKRFADLSFRESYSEIQPFQRLKIKLKKEIITLREPEVNPAINPAPHIEPEEFKEWLDEKRDITILDTRNDYEVRFGTFKNATNFSINNFCEFPEKVEELSREKPIVMFCTGGIRCEKAALYLMNKGFSNVYQLQGGILNYFKEVGGAHYEGECYVFDERISVDSNLQKTGTTQCLKCQGPVNDSVCKKC